MDENRNTANAATDKGLYEELVRYCAADHYPYHMPGHKRRPDAGPMAQYYGIDITEIDGFDNLHHAEGILQAAQQRANRLYGSAETETFYLINGSTCGVLAAVMTAAARGAEILIARNCHKSVYHAAILQELNLHYYEPPILEEYGTCGGVDAGEIDRLLQQYPDCTAVVITSPTYEGILSDVKAVADVVHGRDKILIVDEAHGAHLGLHESVPAGALAQGADLVIHSLHKTLPAMTQTALLHVQGERIDRGRLRSYLAMLQSSSPSYVLMASMDSCIRYLERHGAERYLFMQRQYELFCKRMEKCRYIVIGNLAGKSGAKQGSCIAGWDIGKLVISVKDRKLSGQCLYDLLRDEYHLQMEMAAECYVLAIMTVMDGQEGWQRLADALEQIDDRIERGTITVREAAEPECDRPGRRQREAAEEEAQRKRQEPGAGDQQRDYDRADRNMTIAQETGAGGQQRDHDRAGRNMTIAQETGAGDQQRDHDCAERSMTIAQASLGPREEVPAVDAVGRTAADFINLYPPGIPLVVPGEVISDALPGQLQKYGRMGLQLQGVTADGKICVTSI